MTKKTKKKKFDCVEMKKKGSAYIYEQVKNMSLKEELEYWKQKDEELLKLIATKKKKVA